MSSIPEQIYCEQLEPIKIYFINQSSTVPVGNIRIATNGLLTSKICFNDPNRRSANSFDNFKFTNKQSINDSDPLSTVASANRANEPLKFHFTHTHRSEELMANPINTNTDAQLIYSLEGVVVQPGESYEIDMWIRGPESEGEHSFFFMFFYEDASKMTEDSPGLKRNLAAVSGLRYRLVPYEMSIRTVKSVTCTKCNVFNSQIDSSLILNLELTNHKQVVS